MSFDQLGLRTELLLDSTDVIGRAQTGTGKTAAFGFPLIQRIDPDNRRPQAVVLSPTRELCLQIAEDVSTYAKYMNGIRCAAIYGGASMADQIRRLKAGAQVLVATPGRLLDLMRRRAVDVRGVSLVVLDEADEMLNMGFKEELDGILTRLPASRRTWLFSATMPPGVGVISKDYLHDPVTVSGGDTGRSLATLSHTCHVVRHPQRYQALKRLVDSLPDMFGLVFCRTRKDTQTVADALVADGFPAAALHGDLSQGQRDAVMRQFRQSTVRMMVATDVAARGLDVEDITHVIHYDLPGDAEAYTHRSGRTARAGKTGASVVIATRSEMGRLRLFEKQLRISFSVEKLPSGTAVRERQIDALAARVQQAATESPLLEEDLDALRDAFSDLDRNALIQALVPAEIRQMLIDCRNAENLDANPKPMGKTAAVKRQLKGTPTRRFIIDVGRADRINEGAILRLVCEQAGIRSNRVGAIDLKPSHCIVEVDQRAANSVRKGVRNATLDGRQVNLREYHGGKPSTGSWKRSRPAKRASQATPGRRQGKAA